MRILLLVDCYLPSPKSSAKLVHDLGIELQRQGHDVTIAAPDDTLESPCVVSREEGLIILRVRTGQIKGASRLRRAYHELRLSKTMWRGAGDYLESHPCDLVIFYSPTIFFSGLVRRLKAAWDCPAYLILRDIFPQWAIDAGVLREGLISRFFRIHEQLQYRIADIVGVQSPANLDYFDRVPRLWSPRLEVLFNWTAIQEPQVPRTQYRALWELDDKVVFFYGGNLGVAQDIDNLLRLASRLSNDPRAHFLFVGEGSEFNRLRHSITAGGMTNVSLHPAVSQETYLGMLAEFDIGLISLDSNLRTQNFPGKMLGYMYHSLPILASLNPGNDLGQLLETERAGFACLNGEDERLADYARQLIDSALLRAELGRNGRRLLESTFSAQRAAEQIIGHFANAEAVVEVPRREAA